VADVDAIVVGAGHNGLAAALELAHHGWSVLVLERSQRIGGASKSDAATLPGFIHDLYAMNIGLFLSSPVWRHYAQELMGHGFQPVVSPHPYASVFPDDTGLMIHQDAAMTRAELSRKVPEDLPAWERLVDDFTRLAPGLLPLLQLPLPSWAAARQSAQLLRRLGREGAFEVAELLLMSPRTFVERRFQSPKMQALLIPWAFHLDYGPDVAGGALFPFIEGVADHLNGMAIARGGVSALMDALGRAITQRGGRILTETEVSRVIVRQGRAVAVETADGRQFSARRAIVANITPTRLFGGLLPEDAIPSRFLVRIRKFRYGPGTAMLHLALNAPVAWAAGEGFSESLYVHVAPWVDDTARTYQEVLAGLLPSSPLLVVGQPTAIDPSRAPDGQHTLWVQVRAVPAQIHGDAAGVIRATTWGAAQNAFVERILTKLEQYAPGISHRIRGLRFFGPLDLEADNPNLVGGDSLSGSHHLDQHYLFRPVPGWSRYRTPIGGLYMVGASTWPGAGLNATSGYLAAQDILRRNAR
jgi:phytoene dehydrogenase-like protein